MTDWDRLEEQTQRALALTPEQRLFALLMLRYDDPDALGVVLAKAEEYGAQQAARGAS